MGKLLYNSRMRIGIFDSGLGGLIITKAIISKLPRYNYTYLGDTKRVPYGNRSQKEILKFTKLALTHLFVEDCKLVIIACNTSSAKALRKIQQEFLPKYFPDRKVLGVIVPTLEAINGKAKRVGVIATKSTALSHAYKKEIAKITKSIQVFEQAAPQLVPYIENNTLDLAGPALDRYLKPLMDKNIDSLILGCTHYPILKKQIQKKLGPKVQIYSQEEIIPGKLQSYLKKHREIDKVLSKNSSRLFQVTALNKNYKEVSKNLFGKTVDFKLVKY